MFSFVIATVWQSSAVTNWRMAAAETDNFKAQGPPAGIGSSASKSVSRPNGRSFPFGGRGRLPDARGLRDWDVSDLINQGLPLPGEVDADMLLKLLKQNLQLPLDPRVAAP
jgi:hypothetical protein